MLRLLRDRHFWFIAAILSTVTISIYSIETYFFNLAPSAEEKGGIHLVLMVVQSGLFLTIVGIAAWRFKVRGGFVTCIIIGLILLPHVVSGLTEPLGPSFLAVYFIGAVSGIFFSLLVGTRKQIESELEEHRNKLEEQVKKRTAELDGEIKRRIDYTRALVHELKTPLTAVMSSSEVLSTNDLRKGEQLRLAKNIYRGAFNLNKRIDELLDVAKSEIGVLKITYQLFNPLKLIHEVAEDMSLAASRKGQTLTLEAPEHLQYFWADKQRLEQIFFNLLSNAIKFNRKDGKVVLRVKEEAGYLIIDVQDEGNGISSEDMKRLFVPYSRLESDRERLSGLGLGLTLCKKLAELHQGKIWVRSKEGKGSTFSFSIPQRNQKQSREIMVG